MMGAHTQRRHGFKGAGPRLARRRTVRMHRAGMQVLVLLGMSLFGVGTGCAARVGRDYGHVLFPAAEHFQVQLVTPAGKSAFPVMIQSLLLLPPVGDVPEGFYEGFHLALWQEMQQILPGVVQSPRTSGRYEAYTGEANLIADDGKISSDELERIGRLAGTSHVLIPRIIDYRPYHPQRIVMEWSLLDVQQRKTVLILAGGLDASEQRVLMSADAYLRERKAHPYTPGNLDILLRSPRAFSGFAVAKAVGALKGKLVPEVNVDVLKPPARNDDSY